MPKVTRVGGHTRFDTRNRSRVGSADPPDQATAAKRKAGRCLNTTRRSVIDAANTDDTKSTLPAFQGRRVVSMADAFRALLMQTSRRAAADVRSSATLAMQRQHVRYWLEHIPPATRLEHLTSARLARAVEAEAVGRRELVGGHVRRLSGGTLRKRVSTLRQALELARPGRVPQLPEIPYRYTPRT